MRIFIGVIMVLAIIYVCHEIRKKRIDLRHALIWLVVGFLLLLMDVFPTILTGLSGFFGFALPVNMLFFLGFLLSIMILFELSAKVSKQSDQHKKLVQDIGILSKRIEELERQMEDKNVEEPRKEGS